MKYNEYEGTSGSGFMKLIDGENKVRFVCDAEQFTGYDKKGKPKDRFVAYVIDRSDGKVKPLTFGPQIMGQVAKIAKSSEYGFSELPPFDFIINKTGSGLDTEYIVSASRKDSPLTQEELDEVGKQNLIGSLATKLGDLEEKKRQLVPEETEVPNDDEPPQITEKDLPF